MTSLCDIAKFGYFISKAPNNTLSSTQIQNEVCPEKNNEVLQEFFVKKCGMVVEKIPALVESFYQCSINEGTVIRSFVYNPCNPIRWDPNALVEKFCSPVGNNTESFNTTTPNWDSTTIPTTETLSWDSTTPAEDSNNDINIIKLIGVSAIAVVTIGGMIYTWYKCSKSSQSTSKNTTLDDIELGDMSYKQADKVDQETTCLLNNPPSHTITEIINVYEIINNSTPVLNDGTQLHNATHHNAAQEVSDRLNNLLDEIKLDDLEQMNKLMNIVTSPNDHIVPSNEPALLGNESNDVQSGNADQEIGDRLNNLLDDLMTIATSPNDYTAQSNEPVLLGDDMTVNEIV